MIRSETGNYSISTLGGETVKALIPLSLPPVPPLDLTGSRQRLLERATIAVGRLDSVATLLPDPDLFLYAYVRREAVLSSQIEGTQSSLSDLLLFEIDEVPGVPFDDVVEVSNYIAALNHGMSRLKEGFPLSNRLLREMHAQLMSRGRGSDKNPGEFRRSQNWIGGTRPGNAHFVPPPPHEVDRCMGDLEKFLHDDHSTPLLLKAALAHVQFETIHPFLDGNGRLGRLLIVLLLHEGGLLSLPLLYLSLYLKKHRNIYYEKLDIVRTQGDWESWLDFFLEGVEETALGAVETVRRLVALFEKDRKQVQETKRLASNILRVFHEFEKRPILNLKQICRNHRMTFPTATKAVSSLIEMGIIREMTGQKRNRFFVYDAYLKILNEGGDPL